MSKKCFIAKAKLWCKLYIHTSTSVYLFWRVRLQYFQGGNVKILNLLKVRPQLRAVQLGLRYQGNSSSINFSGVFSLKQNASSWAQKVMDESLPATALSAHSGFSKGRPCLHVIIIILTSVYGFSWWGDGAVGKSCIIDLRVEVSNQAGQLLICFHNVLPVLTTVLTTVLTKTPCRHSSLVPKSCIKAFMCKPGRCSPWPLASLLRYEFC